MALHDPEHPLPAGHTALNLSARHRANLRALALHLLALPEDYGDFHMGWFFGYGRDNAYPSASPAECGTVACALGHGPAALGLPLPGDMWTCFSLEHFGLEPSAGAGGFLFSHVWTSADNTAHGAGRRILYALRCGVPPMSMCSDWSTQEDLKEFLRAKIVPLYAGERP